MALVIAPGMASATYGVKRQDASVAPAMVNTMQQIGGSIGTALLSTVVTDAINGKLDGVQPNPQVTEAATIHGYTIAFWWAAAIFAAGAVVCGLLLRPGVQEADPDAAPVLAH